MVNLKATRQLPEGDQQYAIVVRGRHAPAVAIRR